jgi:hypothetical protein
METASTSRLSETLPRLRALFSESSRATAITRSLTALSMCFQQRVDLNELTFAVYVESLEMLEAEELALAFTMAQLEPWPYFPTPGELRKLAGVETSRQRSEREAREALQWLLRWLRKHTIEGRPTRGALLRPAGRDADGKWLEEKYEWFPAPLIPDGTVAALKELGAGDAKSGCQLIAEHPVLAKDPDEYPSLGLKLAAADKLEARWLEAWRRSE